MSAETTELVLVGRWSAFDRMSGKEVHDLLRLRQDIFVVEQGCAFPDIDGKDPEALHFRLFDEVADTLVGALRVFLPEAGSRVARIGRVVMRAEYRGGGRGRMLMEAGLAKVRELVPTAEIELSAQSHLHAFYAGLGFKSCSQEYLEDGIPHVDMVLQP
ncbi:GNAT family N-acetyltransferase [Roseibium sp.]|uniref:GNAT family N-acetyltransferase n=1 Tax=Roseibium sp. TaxID=1936156 RepID=UPI003A979A17